MTSLLHHYRMFAGYNAWANALLHGAASRLSDEQFAEDRGAFFKSVKGTLNHLLVTDLIWMRRCTGEGQAPDRLDAVLHDHVAVLTAAQRGVDTKLVAYVRGLDEDTLAGNISYRRVSTPQPQEQPLSLALAHWFNHQTHHRGQAHAIITALGQEAPELDLLFYQRLVAQGSEPGWG